MAKTAIVGMGPVGLATAWHLLRHHSNREPNTGESHTVSIIDIDSERVAEARAGRFTQAAPLADDLAQALKEGRLTVHSSWSTVVAERSDRIRLVEGLDSVVIAVGTPASENGYELMALLKALLSLREARFADSLRHVVIRCTLLPGTHEDKLFSTIEKTLQWQLERDVTVSYYPEFLREKQIREDILAPPLKIAAHSSPEARARFARLFSNECEEVDFATAESIKLACNAFHALKVVFANEFAEVCRIAGGSSERLMQVFSSDQKLNISNAYLKPGAAFGGPCLEKDLRALEFFIQHHGLNGRLLNAIRASNDQHKQLTQRSFT
jgi:GDP-mannose 6-dehydrogenase